MKLRYNRKDELEIPRFGAFEPNQIIKIGDEEKAKRYLDSGYFDEIKKRMKRKVKKHKTKEVINNATR